VPQFSSSDTNPRQVCEPPFGKKRADTEKGEQTLGDDEELHLKKPCVSLTV
jgi:hypothetical protein